MTELVLREDQTNAIDRSLDRSERPPEPVEDVDIDERVREQVREALSERESLPRLPVQVIDKYADIAIRHANLKRLPDGDWFAKIPGFQGVWASESSEEQTLGVLKEVVVDWALLKIEHKDNDLPVIEEINLNDL